MPSSRADREIHSKMKQLSNGALWGLAAFVLGYAIFLVWFIEWCRRHPETANEKRLILKLRNILVENNSGVDMATSTAMHGTTKHIILYVKEGTLLAEKACVLLNKSPVPVILIPTSLNIPEASFQGVQYIGLGQIEVLARVIKQEVTSDEISQ